MAPTSTSPDAASCGALTFARWQSGRGRCLTDQSDCSVRIEEPRGGWPACIGRRLLGPGPFGEDREETGDVFGDLPGFLAVQVMSDAGLPDLTGPPDQFIFRFVICCVPFHRRPHGRFLTAPLLASGQTRAYITAPLRAGWEMAAGFDVFAMLFSVS
jgi:hypothetical protein